MTQSVDIVQYMDYVPYINDLVKKKKEEGRFTYRDFCQKSGFKSPTYLKWVIDRERPISPKSVHRFAEGLELSKRESRYFQLLVNYQEHKDPEQKKFFFEEILTTQNRREENNFIKERYEYLSHWYTVTIRELIGHPEFSEDPEWIRQKLRGTVTIWDIKSSLLTLEKLGLVARNDMGRLVQNDADLHTGKEVESMAAYNYHSEVLDLSREILMETSHEVRDFSSVASLVDKETFDELKQKMSAFQEEIVGFLTEKEKKIQKLPKAQIPHRELYMLNMQLLPFTRFEENHFLGKKEDEDL